MTGITQAVTASLLHFVWQGLLVAFGLWVALIFMRKRSANARYLVCCAVLALMAAMPLLTAGLQLSAAGETRRIAVPAAPPASSTENTASLAVVTSTTFLAGWLRDAEPWALPLWSAGVLLFAIRAVWAYSRIAAMRRWGRAADEGLAARVDGLARRIGLSRPVQVLETAWAEAPSVIGWIKPVILLPPAAALGLTPEQLEAVLAHELAHIHRHDHLVNAAQILIETLLFYHPAVWWVSGRIRHERELCCDDLAVRSCGDALCYARALSLLERLRLTAPAMATGSTDGSLLYRIQRLMGSGNRELGPSKFPGIVAMTLGVVCLALTVHWAGGQQREIISTSSIERTANVELQVANDSPGVTVELFGATVAERGEVNYPQSARNAGVQGTVEVEATLGATGNVMDARILSGPVELRKTVMQSVLNWRFAPASAGTTRVVKVTFQKPPAGSEGRLHVYTYRRPDGKQQSVTLNTAVQEFSNEHKVAAAVNAWENASPDERKAVEEEVRSLRKRIEEMRSEPGTNDANLAETERMLHAMTNPPQAADPRVAKIEISGLPEGRRAELMSQLPVHVGDILQTTTRDRDRIRETVARFGGGLEVSFEPAEGGGTAIWISRPEGWQRK